MHESIAERRRNATRCLRARVASPPRWRAGSARGALRGIESSPVPHRQKLLILYLSSSSLDANVVAWSSWDGTGETESMAGDAEEPPYASGLAALRDGWRLIQLSPLLPHAKGEEFTTSYLKYEFVFEQWLELP